ncbi:hypothetical protein ACFW3D_41020 [Streptomyces sp. NPDC058864]
MSQAVEYDHLVVGAGTAAGVPAARLTEDGGARFLPLEAGGSEVPEAMPETGHRRAAGFVSRKGAW